MDKNTDSYYDKEEFKKAQEHLQSCTQLVTAHYDNRIGVCNVTVKEVYASPTCSTVNYDIIIDVDMGEGIISHYLLFNKDYDYIRKNPIYNICVLAVKCACERISNTTSVFGSFHNNMMICEAENSNNIF